MTEVALSLEGRGTEMGDETTAGSETILLHTVQLVFLSYCILAKLSRYNHWSVVGGLLRNKRERFLPGQTPAEIIRNHNEGCMPRL